MNNQEVIEELEYMIQRGINPNIHIVFKVLSASLLNNDDYEFAGVCQQFASEMIKRLNAKNN